MQMLVQWHYSFIQLNKPNYSLCLSFHRVVSIWMKFGMPLTSLKTKVNNHHTGICVATGSKILSSKHFQLWLSVRINTSSILKWYTNTYVTIS